MCIRDRWYQRRVHGDNQNFNIQEMKVLAIFILALLGFEGYTEKWVYYSQCDPQWAGDHISTGSKTICQIGCLISSMAMAMGTYDRTCYGKTCNPGLLNRWLTYNGGYEGNLFKWDSVAAFGLNFLGFDDNVASIKSKFADGNVVILNVNQGHHWVLMTGALNNGFAINDPGYNKEKYGDEEVVSSGIFAKDFMTVRDLLAMIQVNIMYYPNSPHSAHFIIIHDSVQYTNSLMVCQYHTNVLQFKTYCYR
eukprot:TRINITY_DN215_c0_g1_i7.p1 TRINITY_DN215_c0_g1~~TRINITY_DN215_c0_g1_i7.p1  ORF type:complete len:291 (+),score=37.33 TRINITY_DN215_c0_g1_i7:126-875(+)